MSPYFVGYSLVARRVSVAQKGCTRQIPAWSMWTFTERSAEHRARSGAMRLVVLIAALPLAQPDAVAGAFA